MEPQKHKTSPEARSEIQWPDWRWPRPRTKIMRRLEEWLSIHLPRPSLTDKARSDLEQIAAIVAVALLAAELFYCSSVASERPVAIGKDLARLYTVSPAVVTTPANIRAKPLDSTLPPH